MNSSNGSDSILLSMLSGGLLNEKFVGIPQGLKLLVRTEYQEVLLWECLGQFKTALSKPWSMVVH